MDGMKSVEPWEGGGSRLPSDPAYWDDLARRVVAGSADLLATRAGTAPPWWSGMARHAGGLSLLAVAAMIATLTLIPAPRTPGAGLFAGVMAQTLQPSDPHLRGLVGTGAPPDIEAMLLDRDGGRP